MMGEYIKLSVRVTNVEQPCSFRAPRKPIFRSERPLLRRDSKGISTIEYAVLFIAIVVGAIVAWKTLGDSVATRTGHGEEEVNRILKVEGSGTGNEESTSCPSNPTTSSSNEEQSAPRGSKKSRSAQHYDPR